MASEESEEIMDDDGHDIDESELDEDELDDDDDLDIKGALEGDDDLDDDDLDDDEDEDGAAPARKPADDDEEEDDDEIEADLDAILKDRLDSGDDEDDDEDDDDNPAAAKKKAAPANPEAVAAKTEDERTCESCWLIKPLIQFPDDGVFCIDCA